MKKNFLIKNRISICFAYLRKQFKRISRKLKKMASEHPLFFQFLQITLLYFYATVLLIFGVRNATGFFPETLDKIFPFANQILNISILKFIATPEKTFFIYLLVMEAVLNRENTSLLVKYNLLLVFLLEMLQNLILSIWDLLLNRELKSIEGNIIFSQMKASNFFTFFFLFVFSLYLYCYFHAIAFKFVSFPRPFEKITNSVAFWLNLKKVDRNNKKKKKGDS